MDTTIDDRILRGHYPPAPADTTPRPAPGASYYWDCRAEGYAHAAAVRRAARQMGAALACLQAVSR
ncbi:MAG: hypothetical protein ACRD3G_12210 [Vicinamibacterales bacterium]